jgi:hypothetical protein
LWLAQQHWVVTAFSELGQQDFARWLANSVVVAPASSVLARSTRCSSPRLWR